MKFDAVSSYVSFHLKHPPIHDSKISPTKDSITDAPPMVVPSSSSFAGTPPRIKATAKENECL